MIMNVEVIQQTVTPQALEAEVDALRKEGCDKAKESKQSIADMELSHILIRQDIEKLKEKFEVKDG